VGGVHRGLLDGQLLRRGVGRDVDGQHARVHQRVDLPAEQVDQAGHRQHQQDRDD
jgi:hypothetical protein